MYKSQLPELPGYYPHQVLVLLQSLIPSSVFVKDLSKDKLRVSYDAQLLDMEGASHLQACEERLIFRHIVGGGERELECMRD